MKGRFVGKREFFFLESLPSRLKTPFFSERSLYLSPPVIDEATLRDPPLSRTQPL